VPPSRATKPRLAPGCRLAENAGTSTLLMPERAMKLNGPGLEIIRRTDGTRTIGEIVSELVALYPGASADTIEQEALTFLQKLWERRAVDLE
jgi:coenzyme PQQ biosynthesis protein PqqD